MAGCHIIVGARDVTLARLFVYGTLRPRGRSHGLIAPLVERHEEAVLFEFCLVGEGHRYPWCVASEGGEVIGDLLWLRRPDEALAVVDRYEGVDETRPEYCRMVVEVFTTAGALSAWAYLGGPGMPDEASEVGGGDWLRGR
jgi:gamma-glutamylcyclotransferase (GGCT)/AIG2-like uncharacterized protein YtfP